VEGGEQITFLEALVEREGGGYLPAPVEYTVEREDRTATRVVSGLILAGGSSRRMGSPKGLAVVGGEPIVRRVLRVHREVLGESVIVTNQPELYQDLGVTLISDRRPGLGPLAGVESGLVWARDSGARGVFCTPCDAPFLEPELIRRVLDLADDHLAVLPSSKSPDGWEPLFAWYSTAVLSALQSALDAGRLSARDFARSIAPAAVLPLQDVQEIGDPAYLFFNANTPDDLALARRMEANNRDAQS
jgi:molybdopterin-guanine dinucleotide biosynthesis protein A